MKPSFSCFAVLVSISFWRTAVTSVFSFTWKRHDFLSLLLRNLTWSSSACHQIYLLNWNCPHVNCLSLSEFNDRDYHMIRINSWSSFITLRSHFIFLCSSRTFRRDVTFSFIWNFTWTDNLSWSICQALNSFISK